MTRNNKLQAKKNKPSSTQETKCIIRCKCPAYRQVAVSHFNNQEEEVTTELLDTDDAQHLADPDYMSCTGLFSEDYDSENWIRCGICLKWSHTLCANFEGEKF
jgi:hypothetical protein